MNDYYNIWKLKNANVSLKDIFEDERTYIVCFEAIKLNGLELKFVPDLLKTKPMCEMAILQNCGAIQFVEEKQLTSRMCLIALKQDPKMILKIPPRIRRSIGITDEKLDKMIKEDTFQHVYEYLIKLTPSPTPSPSPCVSCSPSISPPPEIKQDTTEEIMKYRNKQLEKTLRENIEKSDCERLTKSDPTFIKKFGTDCRLTTAELDEILKNECNYNVFREYPVEPKSSPVSNDKKVVEIPDTLDELRDPYEIEKIKDAQDLFFSDKRNRTMRIWEDSKMYINKDREYEYDPHTRQWPYLILNYL